MSDIEIAQHATMRPIIALAKEQYGIDAEHLDPFGHYKAKISLEYINSLTDQKDGKLILVTAISPTPAGEGKTTTTVGLGDAMNRIGQKNHDMPARTFIRPLLWCKRRRGGRRLCSSCAHGRHQSAFYRRLSRYRRGA